MLEVSKAKLVFMRVLFEMHHNFHTIDSCQGRHLTWHIRKKKIKNKLIILIMVALHLGEFVPGLWYFAHSLTDRSYWDTWNGVIVIFYNLPKCLLWFTKRTHLPSNASTEKLSVRILPGLNVKVLLTTVLEFTVLVLESLFKAVWYKLFKATFQVYKGSVFENHKIFLRLFWK